MFKKGQKLSKIKDYFAQTYEAVLTKVPLLPQQTITHHANVRNKHFYLGCKSI